MTQSPEFSIIDSHIHVFDRSRLSYSWVDRLPSSLRASRSAADLASAAGPSGVEQAVFIEFLVDPGHHLAEATFGQELADTGTMLGAVVASAPVEHGASVALDLDRLASLPAVRGIRRILEIGRFDMAHNADFISGVSLVGERGLVFELGVDFTGLGFALDLVRACPGVMFVLDHLGTPPIDGAPIEEWRALMEGFASEPNVVAKLSGLTAHVMPTAWRKADLVAHIDHAIGCFGPGRVMFGSDWPMLTTVMSYASWVDVVATAAAGLDLADQRRIFRDVAKRIYKI